MSLQATLESGDAGQFFERVMEAPDEAPPQFVNVDRAIRMAADSDDPSLQAWADEMRAAIDSTAEAEAMQLAQGGGEGPIAGMMGELNDLMGMVTNFFKALPQILSNLSDGFDANDFAPLFNLASGASEGATAEADIAARQDAAEQHLSRAGAYLRGAEDADVAEQLKEAEQDVVEVIGQIEGIKPG